MEQYLKHLRVMTRFNLNEHEELQEGNPLARMHKFSNEEGRHVVGISTERPNIGKKEVAARNAELMSAAREAGFGVRKTEGTYEGGRETSHIITAKKPGREAGAELVAFGRKMGKHFGQDSIFHHNGKTARLIGTNETGFPGMDKSEKVGTKMKFNDNESEFQTNMKRPRKFVPKKGRTAPSASPRFTTE